MAYPQASPITLTPSQQLILEQIVRRPTSCQGLVKRVKLILAAAKGINNTQLSVALQTSRTTIRLWRKRWEGAADRLRAAEAKGLNDKQLAQLIISVVQDSERRGTPATFSTEQVVQIVALACERPSQSGRPVTHWTPAELADEAVKRGIVEEPEAGWIFIVDQLNIDQSESLVRLVAECCGLDIDLGIKGHSGILESMSTRATFLAEATHRIRFVYIPKHTSWLNQIECWFSILVRRLLKRASFTSLQDLRDSEALLRSADRLLAFIDYFNRTMAKPFQWKFKGYPVPG
jgi:transposase